jgi:hypothetical protein
MSAPPEPRSWLAGALARVHDERLRAKLIEAGQISQRPLVRRPTHPRAIVVHGAVLPSMTAFALRVTAITHPHDRIVLSAWDDTPPAAIAEVEPFVDDVVLSPAPVMAGMQDRNRAIVSARAGIERARERGAAVVLACRADLAILDPNVFAAAVVLEARYPARAARAHSLRGRIIVPSAFTRKYLLYHPSAIAMLGATDDLLRYWSAPLDMRGGDFDDDGRDEVTLRDLGLEGNPTECYLALQFCRQIGWPVRGDVLDSWALYRDLFAVVDHDWFDLLWLTHPAVPDLDVKYGPRQLVTHAFWRRLVTYHTTRNLPVPEVDPGRITLRQFRVAA